MVFGLCYRILIMLIKKIIALALLFLLFSVVFSSNQLTPAQLKQIDSIEVAGSAGVAVYKKGIVHVKRANSDYWQNVELNTRFYPQDTIQTEKNSVCEIKLYGDHILRLEPSSNFSFAERNPGIDRWAAFKLNAGKLWIKVINSAPNAENFVLETPHASISVKGTVFSVESPSGKIVAYEGTIQVTQENLSIEVNAGEQTRINSLGFMSKAEHIDSEGISSFEQFEQSSTYISAKDIKTIRNRIITPAKNKTNAKVAQAKKIIKENVSGITQNEYEQELEYILTEDITEDANIIEEPIMNLLISKDKTTSVLEDSQLFRNPAILAKIPINKMNTVYYTSRSDLSILNFNNNYSDNSYISSPEKVNAGTNERLEENQILGVRTLERGTGVGVHFKKQRYLQLVSSSNANLYQNNILNLFYGKSFQIQKNTNIGLLIRSSIITSTKESKTSFTEPFQSLFSAGTESSFFYYGLDFGLLYELTQQLSVGISYKGLFAHEILGFEEKDDNSLYLTGMFFSESQTTEVSIKTYKNNNSIIASSLFKLAEAPNALFNARAELSQLSSVYSLFTNIETSSTFQLFFKLSLEQMNLIADNSIIVIGGQLDF